LDAIETRFRISAPGGYFLDFDTPNSDYSGTVVGTKRYIFTKYNMTTNQHQQEQELFETFKKFSDLYRSKVEYTGETLRTLDPFKLPMDPSHPITYKETEEIAIKMPRDEYERFLANWSNYIDLMYVANHNPMIREEFHKIHMLVQLLK